MREANPLPNPAMRQNRPVPPDNPERIRAGRGAAAMILWRKCRTALLAGFLCPALLVLLGACTRAPEFDLVITGGTVIDGSGSPGVPADVAVQGDRIAAIGKIGAARGRRAFDASGMCVVPGFIDMHTHGDRRILDENGKSARNYLTQGVTTLVTGNCGDGTYEVAAYFARMKEQGIGPNIVHLVGHGTVRSAVMNGADRAPTPAELERMKSLVDKAMREGAAGMSTGLFYAPGSFAKADEIVALAEVIRPYGGMYASHIRDESNYTTGLEASIAEAIEIGERAGVPVQISHIKALGRPVWGKAPEICRLIEAARARGVKVYADQYPYNASSTSMAAAVLPRWVEADGRTRERLADARLLPRIKKEIAQNIERRGGPESLVLSSFRSTPELEGKNLLEVSRIMGKTPVEAAIDVILMGDAGVVSFNMSEEDVEFFMRQPWVMTCSDGDIVAFGEGVPHPRSYGAFTRKLRRYALDRNVISLEQAIHAAAGLPAQVLGLEDRGLLKAGSAADLVVFDPAKIADRATFSRPHQYSEGIRLVLVNGKPAVEEGTLTGTLAGRPLPFTPERR